jgi:cell division protein FtsQ
LAGVTSLVQAPQFRVEQVILTRAGDYERVSGTTLQSVASVVGQSVFTISSSRVASQVASLPGVRRARVVTRLPNIVEIEVEERLPIIVWRTFSGDLLVDDQGFVVSTVVSSPDQAGTPLPVVVDTSGTPVSVGDRLPARAILAVGAVAAAFEASRLPLEAVEYGATGLSFVIDGGTRVVMGEPENLNAKFGHMLAVRALTEDQGVVLTTLDVRAPTRPSYRVATPVPAPTVTPRAAATPPRSRS